MVATSVVIRSDMVSGRWICTFIHFLVLSKFPLAIESVTQNENMSEI